MRNENRRLKRKLENNSLGNVSDDVDEFNDSDNSVLNDSNEVLKKLSPAPKQRALQRLKLKGNVASTVRTALWLDRVGERNNGRKGDMKKMVENFILSDINSSVVTDEKKFKKGLRYRLSSLKVLHAKLLADENVDVSYAQFTRLIPSNVVKPKPEDWGTCLYM